MASVLDWNADQLLAVARPDEVFRGTPAQMRDLYQRLVSKWHPDRCADPAAAETFDRVTTLFESARARGPGEVTFEGADGRLHRLRYLRSHVFELGELFIARRRVAFRIAPAHADLFDAGVERIRSLPLDNARIRSEVELGLPRIQAQLRTTQGPVLVLAKDEDQVLLQDLVEHLGGTLPPRHAAWVLSGLFNLACYLEYAGLSHNAIGATTWFVSPREHSGALLGGWWYAALLDRPLTALPAFAAGELPSALLGVRRASTAIDLELIHALGRQLIGEDRGVGFLGRPDIPEALFNAMRLPAATDAVSAYGQWCAVLAASFGRRKFTELALSPTAVYPE